VSYQVIEASVHDANVIELYKFTSGQNIYYQTSAATSYVYNGDTYEPAVLERPAIELAGEVSRQTMEIKCSSTNDIAQLFIAGLPESAITVQIFQGHRSDGNFVMIWSGRVLSVKWGKQYKASMYCEPIFTTLRRGALKQNFSERCPYVVYSSQCGKGRTYFAGTVLSASGLNFTIDTASSVTDGKLVGGTLSIGQTVRTITAHTGTSIRVSQPFTTDAAVGDPCSLSIGCDKSLTACDEWHDNLPNYGGEPYIAAHNPFIGRIV
jgi:hypothetical protein